MGWKHDRGARRDEKARAAGTAPTVGELLRVPPGPVRLAEVDPSGTPGLRGAKDKDTAAAEVASLAPRLLELQTRMYAEAKGGGRRNLLLVLQGMDTAGKGGTVSHVVGLVDPVGVHYTGFKAPTPEERAHDFLWRIRRALPSAGMLGVFDRSHYEDVLVVRVHGLVPRAVWSRRYATINRFEASLAAAGTTVVKCLLHISADEQRRRLLARLDDPSKHWKYNPHDVDERGRWAEYQEAYEAVLTRTSTEAAPWYVVPADRKWYRNWAVTRLLAEHLEAMAPQYPAAGFDVATERSRLKT